MKQVSTDDCWLWAGQVSRYDYGRISVYSSGKSKHYQAHRVMYENHTGEIQEGLTIDHLCKITRCVNPEHLEPVTLSENVYRAKPGGRDNCKRGHPLTEDNIVWRKNKYGKQGKNCKTCHRATSRKWMHGYADAWNAKRRAAYKAHKSQIINTTNFKYRREPIWINNYRFKHSDKPSKSGWPDNHGIT